MNYDEYLSITSEIYELEMLLNEIPKENVIERAGLEARLENAQKLIEGIDENQFVYKAKLTFKGNPVFGSHGIEADFASNAAKKFADAVSAIAAGLKEKLRYMGPIPDRQDSQLLITGTAIGSFGFEFEVPQLGSETLFPQRNEAEKALQKVQELFELAFEGSDDQVTELVEEIHPRAVKKVVDFLEYAIQQKAWCGLEFKQKSFRFQNIDQITSSAERLRENNIHEGRDVYKGEFQGVLPKSRTFEFNVIDEQLIIRGRVGDDIDDADVLNRNYLHKLANIKLHVIQVGQGRPRYTLMSLDDLKLI